MEPFLNLYWPAVDLAPIGPLDSPWPHHVWPRDGSRRGPPQPQTAPWMFPAFRIPTTGITIWPPSGDCVEVLVGDIMLLGITWPDNGSGTGLFGSGISPYIPTYRRRRR